MLKAIFTLFSGTAAGQAITLAVAPIVTRLYTPEEFGLLGIFSSYLAILTLIACLRYESAILLPESEQDAWGIAVLCLSLVAAASLLLALLCFTFDDHLLPLVGAEPLAPYVWLLPVGLLLAGSYQIATQTAIRYREYTPLAYTRVLQSLFGALTQVGGGFLGIGPSALLTGQVIASGSGSLRMANVLGARGIRYLRLVNFNQLKVLAKRYRSFALLGSPAAFMNGLALNLPTILITSIYGASTAGQFFLAQRVLNIPIATVCSAVAQSYMGEASVLHRTGEGRVYRLFWRLALWLGAFSLVLSLGIYYLSPILFSIVFGEQWLSSGVFASYMAYYIGARVVTTSLAPTLVIYERQDISLMLQILSLLAVFSSFGFAWYQDWEPIQAVLLYSLAMTTPYIVGFFLLSRLVTTNDQTN